MRWAYIDESGCHDLGRPDPNYPIFVLCAVLFDEDSYAQGLASDITRLKLRHLGHDGHVLHEVEIRKRLGPFRFGGDMGARERFLSDLRDLVDRHAAAVHATAVLPTHPSATRADVLAAMHLVDELGVARSERLSILLESRGKKEDAVMRAAIKRRAARDTLVDFTAKTHAVPGLELADLVARPIGLSLLRPSQSNRALPGILAKARIDCLK